jgi:hypothetical protein
LHNISPIQKLDAFYRVLDDNSQLNFSTWVTTLNPAHNFKWITSLN